MGKEDSYRFAYDPVAVMQNVPKLLGMEMTWHGGGWQGGYYLNGDRHAFRRDKLKVFIGRGSIWISEEGGRCISLPQWLIEFGGVADFKEALKIIKGQPQSIEWSREFRERINPRLEYVSKDVLEAAKQFDLQNCPLFRWFCSLFPEDRVKEAFDRYNVTTDGQGLAVFWAVNQDGLILHDKRMKYLPTGRRDKSFGGTRQYRTADGYSGRCFFGSHLIPACGNGDILTVESEKSAIGLYLWTGKTVIATAGKNNLRERDPRLLCFPDKDGFEDWEATGNRCVRWFDDWELPYEQQPPTADIMDMIEWKILKSRE